MITNQCVEVNRLSAQNIRGRTHETLSIDINVQEYIQCARIMKTSHRPKASTERKKPDRSRQQPPPTSYAELSGNVNPLLGANRTVHHARRRPCPSVNWVAAQSFPRGACQIAPLLRDFFCHRASEGGFIQNLSYEQGPPLRGHHGLHVASVSLRGDAGRIVRKIREGWSTRQKTKATHS